jgi:hypothetical protein
MTLSRRAAWFLVAFAAWNAFVWATFVKNVYPDHHFDGFFLVHLAIGGLTTAMGLAAGWIGVRALRARGARSGPA